jgi:hypothetical protein
VLLPSSKSKTKSRRRSRSKQTGIRGVTTQETVTFESIYHLLLFVIFLCRHRVKSGRLNHRNCLPGFEDLVFSFVASLKQILQNRHLHANVNFSLLHKSRDSAVGIATRYRLDDQGVGVRVPVGARIFTFPCRPDWL